MDELTFDILFINPPLSNINDSNIDLGLIDRKASLALKTFNPGILSIATYLDWKGYSVKICDILNEKNINYELKKTVSYGKPKVIAISGTYGNSYLNLIYISRLAKKYFPKSFIIVGGQHVSALGGIVLEEAKEIDAVITSEGEIPTKEFLEFVNGQRSIADINGLIFREELIGSQANTPNQNIAPYKVKEFVGNFEIRERKIQGIVRNTVPVSFVELNELPPLKYSLYPDYKSYKPYVEESRGCYGECAYCTNCTNGTKRKYRYKNSDTLLGEMENLVNIYGKKIDVPVLASTFGVNTANTIKICEGIMQRFGKLNWFAETRLDTKWEEYIELAYKSGSRFFEVGMESASPFILKLMKKTHDSSFYLDKASKLIDKVTAFSDTKISFNFMAYAGENYLTLKQSLEFIMKNFNDQVTLDYFSLIAMPGTTLWDDIPLFNEKYGTTIVKNSVWDQIHLYPVNPSREISYQYVSAYTHIIQNLFRGVKL